MIAANEIIIIPKQTNAPTGEFLQKVMAIAAANMMRDAYLFRLFFIRERIVFVDFVYHLFVIRSGILALLEYLSKRHIVNVTGNQELIVLNANR
jgi:hypothetical protein